MGKGIKWLRNKLVYLHELDMWNWKQCEPNSKEQSHFYGCLAAYERVLDFLDELDEPEVTLNRAFEKVSEIYPMTKGEVCRHLEQVVAHGGKVTYGEPEVLSREESINIVLDDLKEYIKEQQSLSQNVGMAHTPSANDTYYRKYDFVLECIEEYEPSDSLENLLMPKKELPVVPRFVAEWIKEMKQDERPLYSAMSSLMNKTNHEWAIWKTTNKNFSEIVAQAWLDGFTIANEPLYRARLKVITDEYIASYLRTRFSDNENRLKELEIGNKYIYEDYRHLSEFTEDELKELGIWDSEQWVVEEVEE